MKRIVALILALAMVFVLVLSFVSCSLDDLDKMIEEYSTMVKDNVNGFLGSYLKEDPTLKKDTQ